MKRILIFILIFIIGTISGIAGTVWLGKVNLGMKTGMAFITMSYADFEFDEAKNQYLFPLNIDVSIYALKHLINFNENYFEQYIASLKKGKDERIYKLFEKTHPYDLAVAYVRLGNLYEKKNNKQMAFQSFNKGLEIALTQKVFETWKGTEKEIKTVDDLRRFVEELDDRLRKQKQKQTEGTELK